MKQKLNAFLSWLGLALSWLFALLIVSTLGAAIARFFLWAWGL